MKYSIVNGQQVRVFDRNIFYPVNGIFLAGSDEELFVGIGGNKLKIISLESGETVNNFGIITEDGNTHFCVLASKGVFFSYDAEDVMVTWRLETCKVIGYETLEIEGNVLGIYGVG